MKAMPVAVAKLSRNFFRVRATKEALTIIRMSSAYCRMGDRRVFLRGVGKKVVVMAFSEKSLKVLNDDMIKGGVRTQAARASA